MRQRQRLGQIIVKLKAARQRPRNLRHLDRMGQAGAVMVTLILHKDLRFIGQTPEGGRMDDAVTIAAKFAARGRGGLGLQPATAFVRQAGIGHQPSELRHVSPRAPMAFTISLPRLYLVFVCH